MALPAVGEGTALFTKRSVVEVFYQKIRQALLIIVWKGERSRDSV